MKVITFRSKSIVSDDCQVEQDSVEVADMEGFWKLIKDLDADSRVDSVMIGLDMQDSNNLALDILLR